MDPVECDRCHATVLVSKASAAQTSIQWEVDSAICPARATLPVGDTCPHLSDAIRDAVFAGHLAVSGEQL